MRKVLVSLASAVLIAVPLATAGAAPPASTQHDLAVTLSDAPDNVVKSDGLGTYAGHDTISNIIDYVDPGTSDHLRLQPWKKRHFKIQHALINSGAPTQCSYATMVFTSTATPDWYNAGYARGDGFLLCTPANQKGDWIVAYPDGAEECLEATRVGVGAWVFEAAAYSVDPETSVPTGCPAKLVRRLRVKGSASDTVVAERTSAPFQVFATES